MADGVDVRSIPNSKFQIPKQKTYETVETVSKIEKAHETVEITPFFMLALPILDSICSRHKQYYYCQL